MAGTGNVCITCHRQDDIHQNSLSPRCGECHTQWAFAPARFDHSTVGCNLTGLHRTLACNDCHAAGNYGAIVGECIGCHRDEAVRKGGVHAGYTQCAGCHNPNDWQAWTFDHTAQTDFALDGAHAGLDCNACHRKAVETVAAIDLATSCGSCHRKDDAHGGEFGPQCERCHTAESFRQLRVLQ